MGTPTGWPRGALPLGPSVYENAMTPIYNEAVWREQNFYKAEGEENADQQAGSDPSVISTPSLGWLETLTTPVKDFGSFLKPDEHWDIPRIAVVVGGLILVGYLIGHKR